MARQNLTGCPDQVVPAMPLPQITGQEREQEPAGPEQVQRQEPQQLGRCNCCKEQERHSK